MDDVCVRVNLTLFLRCLHFFDLQLRYFFFLSFDPALLHSLLFLITTSPLPLLLFLPLSPSVTIATEERPFIEKGIRLAGPPSHLARRGG